MPPVIEPEFVLRPLLERLPDEEERALLLEVFLLLALPADVVLLDAEPPLEDELLLDAEEPPLREALRPPLFDADLPAAFEEPLRLTDIFFAAPFLLAAFGEAFFAAPFFAALFLEAPPFFAALFLEAAFFVAFAMFNGFK